MTHGAFIGDLEAVALLDEPVRRRLYDWVAAQQRPVSREEAARTLGISRPLAAFHLDRLTRAGLLDASYKRLTGRSGPGAGRPARVYERADREIEVSLPARHYEFLADLFAASLQEIGDGTPPKALVDAAHDAGERMADQGAVPHQNGLLTILDKAGYEPSKADDGTIRLRNCPFHALVEEHRSLVCATNLALAHGIVDGLGSQSTHYRPELCVQPGYCCVIFKPSGR